MRLVRRIAILALALSGIILCPLTAEAEPPSRGCTRFTGNCHVSVERDGDRKGEIVEEQPKHGTGSGGSTSSSKSNAQRRYEAEYAAYMKDVETYRTCVSQGDSLCVDPEAPMIVTPLGGGSNNGGATVQVTPAQAGAIAVARLKLPAVGPGIGPSPDLNRWKMAAVGYPLWLWADGPTEVGPVSDSVAGLSVSLRAEVSSLTFRMGDGTTVSCDGAGDKWTEAVEPGAKAPNCGHTYTKPSLPKGSYAVAALTNWAVTWTANGQSGVINVPAAQATELPVGELQVLVR